MIVHHEEGGLWIEWESWKERLAFFVSADNGIVVDELLGWKRHLYYSHREQMRWGFTYFIWPIGVLVILKGQWYGLARWCYEKGLIRASALPPPGEVMHWFWPRYVVRGWLRGVHAWFACLFGAHDLVVDRERFLATCRNCTWLFPVSYDMTYGETVITGERIDCRPKFCRVDEYGVFQPEPGCVHHYNV